MSDTDQTDNKTTEQRPQTFAELGVNDILCKTITQLNWKSPTAIQCDAIPHALAGRDVIGLAETGSGKTGAFGIPLLQALIENPQPYFGLILAPTRELAFQISEQLTALGSSVGVRCIVIVGGVDMMDQAIALAKKPHIIVASPGRIIDHLENTKGFNLRTLQWLILDEADRLLNMDFEHAIDQLLQCIPKQRHTMLFSATMTSKVSKLQRASLQNPVKVQVSNKYSTVQQLIQNYIFIPAKYKELYLVYILNELAGQSSIIFCSTCDTTKRISLLLRNLGFHSNALHGKMDQQQRLQSLNKFRASQQTIQKHHTTPPMSITATLALNANQQNDTCNILVCTDVASRGLDIPNVDIVINYDIPSHSKDYIHRVGRTARAGKSGRSITIVTQYDVELLQRIEQLIEKQMILFPTDEQSVMILSERVNEANRLAVHELREIELEKKERRANKKSAPDDTEETGTVELKRHKGNYKTVKGKSKR